MHNTTIHGTILARLHGLIRLMRPEQWLKNSFVLAPLMFSGEFLNVNAVSHALFATLLFCLASSATYIINDIHDIEQDRRHLKKCRTRPLASSVVTIRMALILLTLLCFFLLLAWFVAPNVLLVIASYMTLNIAYTFVLKKQPVLDIFTIAMGFVLRVYAGAVALAVPLSPWMFITTLCLALYLAAVKRRQELIQNGTKGREVLNHYSISLIDRYAQMSATGALLFYSMFVMSSKSQLIITVPMVLFGFFRYWYVVEELEGGESPTDALLADWQLLLTVVVWVVVCGWALWPAKGVL